MFPTPDDMERFHTGVFTLVSATNEGARGHLDIQFFSDSGKKYATTFTPSGVQQLSSMLLGHLAQMGMPPEQPPQFPGEALPGAIPEGEKTKTYFGQQYDTDVIQALGVLVIRANQLDYGLIGLYAALTGISETLSANQYYASTNMKARVDVIRSVSDPDEIGKDAVSIVFDAMDRVKRVSDRRNDLIHARWSFRNGKHRADVIKPNSKTKVTELTVTAKMVMSLAEDYMTASLILEVARQSVLRARSAVRSAGSTPSSTDPSA